MRKLSLTKQLENAQIRITDFEISLINSRAQMTKVREMLGMRSNDELSLVMVELQKLIDFKKHIEGSIDERVYLMNGENSRLWYLIRAITGDHTLSNEEVNYNNPSKLTRSPFDKPRF